MTTFIHPQRAVFLSVELEKDPPWQKESVWKRWTTELRIKFHEIVGEYIVPLVTDQDGSFIQRVPITHMVANEEESKSMTIRTSEKELRRMQVHLIYRGPTQTSAEALIQASIPLNLSIPKKIFSGRYSLYVTEGLCAELSLNELLSKTNTLVEKRITIIKNFFSFFQEEITSTMRLSFSPVKLSDAQVMESVRKLENSFLPLVSCFPDSLITIFAKKLLELEIAKPILVENAIGREQEDERKDVSPKEKKRKEATANEEERKEVISYLVKQIAGQQLAGTMNRALRHLHKKQLSHPEIEKMKRLSHNFAQKIKSQRLENSSASEKN